MGIRVRVRRQLLQQSLIAKRERERERERPADRIISNQTFAVATLSRRPDGNAECTAEGSAATSEDRRRI